MSKYFVSIVIVFCIIAQPFMVFAQVATGVPTGTLAPGLTGTGTLTGTSPALTPSQTAQGYTLCANGSIAAPGKVCPNTAATNQVLNRFNPGVTTTTNGGNTFNGLNFSGVGGAVLSCANIGQSIVSSVSDLFSSAQKDKVAALIPGLGGALNATSEEQPVTDQKATAELQKETERENCLNGIAYAVAKNSLQQISSSTLNWINTGFNGNPFYVRDVPSYLTSIQNQKITDFLATVPNSDPIFGNALRSTITELTTGYDDGRINQAMNTPQAIAYQNFQNDFTQGGWSAFLNPSNNPLGALFKATDSLGNSINGAQQDVKDQLQAGNGFLNMQKCVQYAPANTDSINPLGGYASLCATITPGNQAYCKTYASQAAAGAQQQKCIQYETVTPGSILQAQTVAITTSPIRQAEQADKINEVLGSFFDGLVNRLFSQGLGSLIGSSNSTSTSNSIGNNVVLGADGLPISTTAVSAEDAFGYQRVNGGFNGEFDISRPQQLRAILRTQMDFLNQSEDTQVKMASIVPTLGRLDYCFPGPNPSWTVGTNYNFQLFESALQGKQPDKTLGNVVSQLSTVAAVIPGPGTLIAAVGNIVGGVINLGSGNDPKSLDSSSLSLLDKVTNGARQISDYHIHRNSSFLSFDDLDLLGFLEKSFNATMQQYQTTFDPNTITNAFVATDPGNAATIKGTVGNIIDETGNLVYYNQAIQDYNTEQVQNITQTQDAINQLASINDEVEGIVATAKARYISQMKAAGTPVDVDKMIDPTTGKSQLCIDNAYSVSATAVVPDVTRVESDIPDPIIQQSRDAATYFYSHL